jgi:hypothetical protein
MILFLLLILEVLTALDTGIRAETRFEKRARQKQAIASQIVWFNHEPLVFYIRRGRMWEDWPAIYERQHAPENIQLMADIGVPYGRLHFYKGLGLKTEMAEIEKSAQMAELMRSHNMRVSLYVAGTMFIEPFYQEVPEAVTWEQRDQNGKWVPYSNTQTFRHFACHNEPAYREYIKKVLKVGVDLVQTNQFFFDNVYVKAEPKSCRCDRCISAFSKYLKEKYPTPEAAFRRFGYRNLDIIRVNEWDEFNQPYSLTTIDDPVLQEWTRFRCEKLAEQCNEFYDYVTSLDPNVSVGFNLKGLYGGNRYWKSGVYHPLFVGKCDFFPFDTGGMHARLDEETGALVAEIRSYKAARTLNMSCTSGGNDLEYAVYMAFNHQKFKPGYGYHGGPSDNGAYRSFTPLVEFFREHNDRYYRDTENVADVAVLRSWPSMAYSIEETLYPTILMEQVLIQYKIPFDIIFDEQIDRIHKYQAVILPGQESLSMEIIDKLKQFARQGGTLIFSGNTAAFNEWRERRRTNPLVELLEKADVREPVVVQEYGDGKLIYFAEVEPEIKRQIGTSRAASVSAFGRPFPSKQWLLPVNHQQIANTISANLSKGLSVQSEAPLNTVMELLTRQDSRETVLHCVNFDQQRRLGPFSIRLKKQFKGEVKSVQLFVPEEDEPIAIDFRMEGEDISCKMPGMNLYSMIVVGQ